MSNPNANMNPNPLGGNVKPVQAMDQMATNAAKIAQGMLNMEHSLQRSLKYMKELSAAWKIANGGGSNSPLLNDSTNAETSNVQNRLKGAAATIVNKLYGIDVNSQSQQLIDKMKHQLDQQMPIPKSMGSRIGGGVSAVAGIAMGMMPNTTDAVAQRMLTQNVASMTGMSTSEITTMSNKMLAGGITGAYSAQAATSILASQGILPTMGSFSNIMGSTGGLSVLTGMSNEQTAQAFGGINSMSFLRVGVRARDSKGNLRAPEEIANDLYRRTYSGNRKLTEAQAAQVFNKNSRSYQNIMAVAGGDADLAAQLQEMMFYQGKSGGKKLNVKDAQNVKDNILKLEKDDPSRAQWNYQGSQANVLEKTGKGLVGGYSAALDATASVNNGMASLAGMLPQVTQAFGNLKGFLDTLPTAGNTGSMLTGGLSAGAGNLSAMYAMRKMSMGLNATEAALGGETVAAAEATGGGALAAGGGTAALATRLAGGGKVSQLLGRGLTAAGGKSLATKGGAALLAAGTYYGLSKAQNRLQQYGRDHHLNSNLQAAGNELFNMGKYAATGAAAGAMLGGPVGAAAGAVAGTAFGIGHSIYDFATGNWGRGALGNGAGDDHNTAKTVKSDLPRNAREAASWAIQQAKSGASGWHNYCEKFVESAWGKPGRYASAISHWGVAVREKRAHHGKDAPPGAFVFWGGGQYGHTAISIGGGKVVSTDILRRGQADIVHIDTITKRWNKPYLGWADPSKSTVLRKGASAINVSSPTAAHEVTPTSTRSSQTPTSSEASMPWYQKALNSISSVFSSVSSSSTQSAGSSVAIASEAIGMSSVASTASLLGFGSSSSPGYSGSDININMTVNIGSTSKVDIQSLARDIKTAIDKEMRNEKIRGF